MSDENPIFTVSGKIDELEVEGYHLRSAPHYDVEDGKITGSGAQKLAADYILVNERMDHLSMSLTYIAAQSYNIGRKLGEEADLEESWQEIYAALSTVRRSFAEQVKSTFSSPVNKVEPLEGQAIKKGLEEGFGQR
jgi:hypothetical protein